MHTDMAGLSSASEHEFMSNQAANAHCTFVTWQRVGRGVGWVKGSPWIGSCL